MLLGIFCVPDVVLGRLPAHCLLICHLVACMQHVDMPQGLHIWQCIRLNVQCCCASCYMSCTVAGGAREATSTLKVTCRAVNAVRPYPSAPAAPVEMWVRQSFPAQDAAGSVHFPIKGDAFAYGLVNFSSADAAAAAKAHVKQLDETRLMHSTAGQMFEWQLAIEFKPVPKARRRQFLAGKITDPCLLACLPACLFACSLCCSSTCQL